MMVLKRSLRSLAAGRDAAADTKVLLCSQLLHPVKHVFEFQSRVRKEVTSRNTIRELISAPRLSCGGWVAAYKTELQQKDVRVYVIKKTSV